LFGSEISKGQRNAETRHSSCARTASRRLEDVPCKSGKTRDHWAITSLKASRKNFKWAEASEGRLAFPRVGRSYLLAKCHMNTADKDQSGPFPPDGSTLSGFQDGKVVRKYLLTGSSSGNQTWESPQRFPGFGLWRPSWRFSRHGSWKSPWSGSDIMQETFPLAHTNHVEGHVPKRSFCRAWTPGNSQH
jgi:hypothetical protein